MKRYVMQRYVKQRRAYSWAWVVVREYDTLEEAKADYAALPYKDGNLRIAESYVQVRYKPIKL